MPDTSAFSRFRLDNGLDVILHPDRSTPIVTINVLYHVGSKNEQRGRTGFAHLFEHLMFDGSRNVPRGGYDLHCTSVGGDNNAFTSSDITDYYLSLPSNQIALGLWLESDRMDGFAIEEVSLETQKRVVIEEKKQTTDDVPYGSMPILMRAMSYDPAHPYSWDTIGSTEDVEAATMDDVRSFYNAYYHPANVTLVLAGDFDAEEGRELVTGYFGSIPAGPEVQPPAPDESLLRRGSFHSERSPIIPFNAVFLGYHTPSLHHPDSYAMELLASVLSDGESSRLYRSLEYTQEIASESECFIDEGELGSIFYLYAVGQNTKVTPGRLREALLAEIETIARDGVSERELEKVKNQKLTRIARSLQSISSRAERLAWFGTMFDDPTLAFREADLYAPVTTDDIRDVARRYLRDASPNIIEYRKGKG